MGTKESCGEMDLSPRRVGIHFRNLACRSDACGEVLGRVVERTSTPAHDRQALLMSDILHVLGGLGSARSVAWPSGLLPGSPRRAR